MFVRDAKARGENVKRKRVWINILQGGQTADADLAWLLYKDLLITDRSRRSGI